MSITITPGYTYAAGEKVTVIKANQAQSGLVINAAENVLLGRGTGAGPVAEIPCTTAGRALLDDASASDQLTTLGVTAAGKALLDDASASDQRTTLGLGTAATQNYSTGTWTPSVGGTATYTIQQGSYTRIGRMVYIFADIAIDSIGTGSPTAISGLPFQGGRASALSVGYFDDAATSYASVLALLNDAADGINLWAVAAGGGPSSGAASFFTNGTRIIISGCYEANA